MSPFVCLACKLKTFGMMVVVTFFDILEILIPQFFETFFFDVARIFHRGRDDLCSGGHYFEEQIVLVVDVQVVVVQVCFCPGMSLSR